MTVKKTACEIEAVRRGAQHNSQRSGNYVRILTSTFSTVADAAEGMGSGGTGSEATPLPDRAKATRAGSASLALPSADGGA